ncbi:response regulator, partial [Klebsiella pneumoniae]|nr:response regulator [Klebsiella pneumoniae]
LVVNDVPPLPEDADFHGRKILVIDDDMRNIFALTTVLKGRGMEVSFAENGREGIRALYQNPDIELVLMDTMMPEMDGLHATREI